MGSRPPVSLSRMHPELEAHRLKGRYVSVFPGRRAIHLAVVLRQVTLHPIHVRLGNVDATASALHNAAGRHHSPRNGYDLAVHDIVGSGGLGNTRR